MGNQILGRMAEHAISADTTPWVLTDISQPRATYCSANDSYCIVNQNVQGLRGEEKLEYITR